MTYKTLEVGSVDSPAEDLFVELFCEVFGPKNSRYLYTQYPFVDIYGGHRFIDFALKVYDENIAIEIDGESYHNPNKVSQNKYYDDLLKQNSLSYNNWKIYRWTYKQLRDQRDRIKDEMMTFFGELPIFEDMVNINPKQKGKVINLKDHQKEALKNLSEMREKGESIGLLYHATGTGKTYTAISDAKRFGGRTLFIAHTKELVNQAKKSFEELWPEATSGIYMGGKKDKQSQVICASIQSLSANIKDFKPDDFDYLIIDEAHHGTASTYREILSHFKPKFTLGLTATPERSDGENILDIFKNLGHKLDLKTAVELGELVPVRCIRVKTNIDLSDVRINGIRYNSKDLESKLFLPDRNRIIVESYRDMVKDKKTVIFCASVRHAEEIAGLLREENISAHAVSGSMKDRDRKKILKDYEDGKIRVLCACDLLNEGWDSPSTEVLFMARPTLSKMLYIQQLGRGMRKAPGKEYLMVFDFIDNANLFNMPYSLHRILNIDKYRPGEYVLAPENQRVMEKDLIYRGEKLSVELDYPVSIQDYELVDIFDWQEEVEDMVSEIEFVRMVSVQSETIRKYIREEKISPDLTIPMGSRKFHYFKEDKVKKYAREFKWELITPSNIKDKFMDYVKRMDMSYSYKPVFLKAFIENMDSSGKADIDLIVDYFIDFYEDRREKGLIVEKKRCLYTRPKKEGKERYTESEVRRNILSNPFKRFEDMNFIRHDKNLGYLVLNRNILKKLDKEDIRYIIERSDQKLNEYYK